MIREVAGGVCLIVCFMFEAAISNCKSAPIDKWVYEETTDKLTGSQTSTLSREVPLDQGGSAQMTADCRELSLPFNKPFNFLSIRIDFFDKDEHSLKIDDSDFSDNLGTIRYSAAKGEEGRVIAALLYTNEVQLRIWEDISILGRDPYKFADFSYSKWKSLYQTARGLYSISCHRT